MHISDYAMHISDYAMHIIKIQYLYYTISKMSIFQYYLYMSLIVYFPICTFLLYMYIYDIINRKWVKNSDKK